MTTIAVRGQQGDPGERPAEEPVEATVEATVEEPAEEPVEATTPWITATVRPVGTFGRRDVGRLRALLDALVACASIVVLDLAAARIVSPRAAAAIEEAARRLAGAGGCLLCLNADPQARAALHDGHAVLLDAGALPGAAAGALPGGRPLITAGPAAG